MIDPLLIPYVVGQWVRGERFYGRQAQIGAVLNGGRHRVWIAGTRRVGKTSLLKELERLTGDLELGLFPLYWDLQGADDPNELALSLSEALADAHALFFRIGVRETALPSGEVNAVVKALGRMLAGRKLALLLLCDEAEELMRLELHDPDLVPRLAGELAGQARTTWVLASSPRLRPYLERLGGPGCPLRGFAPPVLVGSLETSEAHRLVGQEHLPAASRPRFAPRTVAAIAERCGNHPYLLQLLSKRTLELGDLEEACAALRCDSTVHYLFSVDQQLLTPQERAALQAIGAGSGSSVDAVADRLGVGLEEAGRTLGNLEGLGMVRRGERGDLEVASTFLAEWIHRSEAEDGGHGEHQPVLGHVETEVEL